MTIPGRRDFDTVLIANRGEIALRIVRACRDAGLTSVAVHAEADADAPFVRLADHAVALVGDGPRQNYLDAEQVLAAGAAHGAQAVHPGYGFLAENADFAQAVLDAGLVWIGPPPDVIRELGDKVRARAIAEQVGAPLVPGSTGPLADSAAAVAFARRHGVPVAIKAAHGGGGRGMRIARTLDEIPELFDAAVREAVSAFGRGECFVESYVEHGRHIEAQVLADADGDTQVVGTRDCTLQRRYQKVVEEAPAPFLGDVHRKEIERCAVEICRAAGYRNAGTVEFLLSPAGELSFLEVNTRVQVEHTVTEESSGLDIVLAQLLLAAGRPLAEVLGEDWHDPALAPIRHAIEFRVNAEDPDAGFAPSTGTITAWRAPSGPGVRLDSGVEAGSVVGGQYDSLLAKLVVSGRDRPQAIARARRALAEFEIGGLRTTLPFLRAILREPAFIAEDAAGFTVHTRWIEQRELPEGSAASAPSSGAADGPLAVRIGRRWLPVDLPGLQQAHSEALIAVRAQARDRVERAHTDAGDLVSSPMQGTVTRLAVAEGDEVEAGQLVAVVEAMKMENQLRAPCAGRIVGLQIAAGASLAQGALICRVQPVTEV